MKALDKNLNSFTKEKTVKKIFAKVFDNQTVNTVHSLAGKKIFNEVEFVISTGKEAHVFRAKDKAGNYKAVKIYKIETSKFKHMNEYIEGDIRFKKISKKKSSLINEWTKKEFMNLKKMNNAGVNCPIPLAFKNNVLVMEFIGENGEPAQRIKEKPIKNFEYLYEKIVEFVAKMFYKEEIIHADLSEYNILNLNNEPVIIDVGQAVLRSHPKAREFFEKDLKNVSAYFSKNGLRISAEQIKKDIKSKKALYKP